MLQIFRRNLILSYFFFILLSIFWTHYLLTMMHSHTMDSAVMALDAFLMTVIVFPILYYFFLRPLTQEINERKKTQCKLEIAIEKAELSDKLKKEFLEQMSHEIRTPINQLLGYSEIIREVSEITPESESAMYFEKLENGSRRLIRTIECILEMSQLKTGVYSPDITKVDLKPIIVGLFKTFKISAYANGLQMQLLAEDDAYLIAGDKYGIEQSCRHLIENAVVFTNQGSIDIQIHKYDNHKIIFTITDTGIGISEEYLQKLFHPFSQEDQGYTRSYEGNGLGLALVKEYCSINNAEVTAISAKGKGTIFQIHFNRTQSEIPT